MYACELLPGVPLDIPVVQDPTAIAVFAHGFGDTHDGLLATALGRELPRAGIAVVRVPLAEQAGNDLLTLPFSTQTERVAEALEAAADQYPGLPRYAVGHSQGGLAVAEAGIDTDVPVDQAVLAAVPLTGPYRRFEKIMQQDTIVLPDELTVHGLVGYIPLLQDPGGRRVAISKQYWDEAAELDPHRTVSELYEHHPTLLLFAGKDRVLGSQAAHIARLPASSVGTIQTMEGADHEFAANGYRQKVARLLSTALGHARAA